MSEEKMRSLIEQSLATYNISVTGEIETSSTMSNEYEVEVPFDGELILDNVYENQGSLLYNKKDGEVSLRGIRDGRILLEVKLTD
jgi:hypothetical protein